jgi:hypothetical protein
MNIFARMLLFFMIAKSIQSQANSGLIAIGQGIVAPSMTHTLTYSAGFTRENPVGITQISGVKLSVMADTHGDSTDLDGMGGELGIGNGQAGLSLGFYQPDCDNCEETISGGFGFNFGSFSFGLSASEDIYTAGFLFNATGSFRFGLTSTITDTENEVTSFGAGLGYFSNSWSVSVDASKQATDGSPESDDIILVTPSVAIAADQINLSLNMDTWVNLPENTERDNEFWFGLGYGRGNPYNITVYHDFAGEWTLVGSLFF